MMFDGIYWAVAAWATTAAVLIAIGGSLAIHVSMMLWFKKNPK